MSLPVRLLPMLLGGWLFGCWEEAAVRLLPMLLSMLGWEEGQEAALLVGAFCPGLAIRVLGGGGSGGSQGAVVAVSSRQYCNGLHRACKAFSLSS